MMARILNIGSILCFLALIIYMTYDDSYAEIVGPYFMITIAIIWIFSEKTKETLLISKILWLIPETLAQPKFIGSQAVWGIFIVAFLYIPVLYSGQEQQDDMAVWEKTVTNKWFLAYALVLFLANTYIAIRATQKGKQPNNAL